MAPRRKTTPTLEVIDTEPADGLDPTTDDTDSTWDPGAPLLPVNEFAFVPVTELRPNPRNVRDTTRDSDINELVHSIIEQGILVPLLVLPDRTIVAGHRRQLAGRMAQTLDQREITAPVICRDLDERQQIEAMLAENLRRSDITPIEEATAYQTLLDLGEAPEAIELHVGTKQDRIRRRIALLQLPTNARVLLSEGLMTLAAAEQLGKLREHPDEIEKLLAGRKPAPTVGEPIRGFFEVEQIVRRLAEKAKRTKVLNQLKRAKIPVVERPKTYGRIDADPIEVGSGWNRLDIDVTAHAAEPCHAVTVTPDAQQIVVCTEPTRHPEYTRLDLGQPTRSEATPTGTTWKPENADERRARHAAQEAAQLARLAVIREAIATQPDTFMREADVQTVVRRQAYYDNVLCDLLGIAVPDDEDGRPTVALADWLVNGEHERGNLAPRTAVDPDRLRLAAAAITVMEAEGSAARMLAGADTDDSLDLSTLHHVAFLHELGWTLDDVGVAISMDDQRDAWAIDLARAFADLGDDEADALAG